MIVVIGATGHIGAELISILSREGVAAIAVTRDERRTQFLPGIQWMTADLAEPASTERVLRGVRDLFLLTPNGEDLADLQIGAIRAARGAGVERIVKLSALGASDHSQSPIGRAHYQAETELLNSGLKWTILRPHVFMQNLLEQAPTIVKEGRIYAASGDGKIPFVDTRDIAAVAAATLTKPGHDGRKYVLTGPEPLSYADVARILSEVVGRPVEYVALSLDEARGRMMQAGAPLSTIEGMIALAAYQRAGGPTALVHDTVERILGRPPRSFAEFAKDHRRIFQGPPQ